MPRLLPLPTTPLQQALRRTLDPHKPTSHPHRETVASLTSLTPENARTTSTLLHKRLTHPTSNPRRVQLTLGVLDVCIEKGGETFREIVSVEILGDVVGLARGGKKGGGGLLGRISGEKEKGWEKVELMSQRLIMEWGESWGRGNGEVEERFWNCYQELKEDGVDFEKAMKVVKRAKTSQGRDGGSGGGGSVRSVGNGSVGNGVKMGNGTAFTFLEVLYDCRGLINLFAKEVGKAERGKDRDVASNDTLKALSVLVQTATFRLQHVAEHSNNDHVITSAVELLSKAQETLTNYRELLDTQVSMSKNAQDVVELLG